MKIYQPTRKLRLANIILASTIIIGGCAGGGGRAFIRATDDTLSWVERPRMKLDSEWEALTKKVL